MKIKHEPAPLSPSNGPTWKLPAFGEAHGQSGSAGQPPLPPPPPPPPPAQQLCSISVPSLATLGVSVAAGSSNSDGLSALTGAPPSLGSSKAGDGNSCAPRKEEEEVEVPPPLTICTYHARGSCLRLNCHFFHGTEEQLRQHREALRARDSGGGGDGHGPSLAPPAAPHPATAGGGKRPIVCLSFLSGSCTRADCRFVHLPPHIRPLPTSVCSYYAAGTCRRSFCRYFHGAEEQLHALQRGGFTMYNPTSGVGYAEIPRFDEVVPRNAPAAAMAGSSTVSSSNNQQQQQQQPQVLQVLQRQQQYQMPHPAIQPHFQQQTVYLPNTLPLPPQPPAVGMLSPVGGGGGGGGPPVVYLVAGGMLSPVAQPQQQPQMLYQQPQQQPQMLLYPW